MATEKNISSRIINKHDIEANWNKATNFIPKAGEIIVYDRDETYNYERFKIGDGETVVVNLPFAIVQPDWNQNDENATGYIKNKPMFKINWNGDKTGRETIRVLNSTNSQIYIVKVADCVLFDFGATLEDVLAELESGSLKVATWINQKLNGILSVSQQEQMLQRNSDGTCVGGNIVFEINSGSIRVYQDHADVANLLFVINKDGIWFMHSTHHMTFNDTVADMEGFVYGVSFDAYPGGETINEMLVSPGVNIQSDWNQNDSTALDYVKNRTHWIESSVFVPEQNISNAEYSVDITSNGILEAGSSYSVTVDGASYILDAILLPGGDFSGSIVLGNPEIISHDYSSLDNGLTFAIVYYAYNEKMAVRFMDNEQHTICVELVNIHHLDSKYIKDMYYTGDPFEAILVDNVEMTFTRFPYIENPFQIDEFIEGAIYTVTWNGIVYECTAYIESEFNTPSIGNGSLIQSSGGAGEPFFITMYNDNVILFVSEPGTYTVSIKGMRFEVVKIPEKYLPKKYAGEIVATKIGGGEVSHIYTSEIFNDYTNNEASGIAAHAEGGNTRASGYYSHAEGNSTTASGEDSHAEGNWTTASGDYSHAEGTGATASGDYSHAEGCYTRALSAGQHVQGAWNIDDAVNTYVHIVGNGTWDAQSNAHTLDWRGNAWFAGDVYVDSTSGTNKDEGSVRLATVDEIQNRVLYENTTVFPHNWHYDADEKIYVADLDDAKITEGDIAQVIFNSMDIIKYGLYQKNTTKTGRIQLYSMMCPTENIVIPQIILYYNNAISTITMPPPV